MQRPKHIFFWLLCVIIESRILFLTNWSLSFVLIIDLLNSLIVNKLCHQTFYIFCIVWRLKKHFHLFQNLNTSRFVWIVHVPSNLFPWFLNSNFEPVRLFTVFFFVFFWLTGKTKFYGLIFFMKALLMKRFLNSLKYTLLL